MRNLRMIVSYDGTNIMAFRHSLIGNTIQDMLEHAI